MVYLHHYQRGGNELRKCCRALTAVAGTRYPGLRCSPGDWLRFFLLWIWAVTMSEALGIRPWKAMAHLFPGRYELAVSGDVGPQGALSNHVGQVPQVSPGDQARYLRERTASSTWRGHWSSTNWEWSGSGDRGWLGSSTGLGLMRRAG